MTAEGKDFKQRGRLFKRIAFIPRQRLLPQKLDRGFTYINEDSAVKVSILSADRAQASDWSCLTLVVAHAQINGRQDVL